MSRKKLYNDNDLTILNNLYYAWYSPKEAHDYMNNIHDVNIPTATITRIFASFKMAKSQRFDKSKLLQYNK